MLENMTALDTRRVGAALWVTLNRPGALNALTADMADRLAETFEDAAAQDDVKIVVLTGTGLAFSTGADVSGAGAEEHFEAGAADRANRVVRAITRLDKPVVAAVNGVAAGLACSIVLAADIVIAADSASFVLTQQRVGLMADGGATATIAASVGRIRAMRMALLAEPLSAVEACDAGLVTQVVSDSDFPAAVGRVIDRLQAGPALVYAATKRAINAATLGDLEDALDRERTSQSILLGSEDVAEGIRAIAERRQPRFGIDGVPMPRLAD